MDPNATLRLAVKGNTARERLEALENLDTWIRQGGFAPHWAMEPEGTRRYVARYGWRPSMPESFRK